MVDAGIGADKPVPRLRDDHPVGANQADALVEHDLDLAWIGLQPGGQFDRLRTRGDGGHVHESTLGLRHGLLGDDDDVAFDEGGARRQDQGRKVVTRLDLGKTGDG